MTISYKTNDRYPAEPQSSLEKKWKIAAATYKLKGGDIEVEVERVGECAASTQLDALHHENGHVVQFTDDRFNPSEMSNLEKFQIEVEAWDDGLKSKPVGYTTGTLILDALNGYRRAYEVPDEVWAATRSLVLDWCMDRAALSDYTPLEPDPEDNPPSCGGASGDPNPSEVKDKPGDEGEGEDSDADGDEDEAEGDAEDADGETGSDDDFDDAEDDEDGDGEGGVKVVDEGVDTEERDRWLHTPEGIIAAKRGYNSLQNVMRVSGYDMENLPPLIAGILKGAEEIVPF